MSNLAILFEALGKLTIVELVKFSELIGSTPSNVCVGLSEFNETNKRYDVVLVRVGTKIIQTIKVVRSCGYGLKEAKDLVDDVRGVVFGNSMTQATNRQKPRVILNNLSFEDASKIMQTFETETDSVVSIRPTI